MSIQLAKTAGFCFGVNRAIETIYKLLDENKQVYTLGPIIHNPQMVESLEKRGVRIAKQPEDVPEGAILVIRSHGVPEEIINNIQRLGIEYVDATCPFVSKIHNIVLQQSSQGDIILIAGDDTHPEVEGIKGYCKGEVYVFKNEEELDELLKTNKELLQKKLSVVAQTTYSVAQWKNCLNKIKKVCTNATIFVTICNATSVRQSEAVKLSLVSDLMVIIGGKTSSNTAKLRDVCIENCETILIETAKDLPKNLSLFRKKIAITAGASTPASIIKEVLEKMSEILNKQNNEINEADFSFEELLEESLKNTNTDEKVYGIVCDIAPNEVYVEVEGRKQTGFIPLSELSNDPTAKAEDLVKKGDRLELLIMRTNDQEGIMTLSKKRIDAVQGWKNIEQAFEEQTILEGMVTEVVKGGVIVVSEGIRVFIPASLATEARGEDLNTLVKTTVQFRLLEVVTKGRKRAVGSIRSVLKEQRKAQSEEFWKTVEVGKEYTGMVKSLTSYGAFVDLGGVDGMVHISELSWSRIKHPSEVLKVGDTVTVVIKEINAEKKKISLGYKKIEDNPWEILKRDYPINTITDVEIVGLTAFGAFARVIPGIDGLVHISQIADRHITKPDDVLKVGDKVKAMITDVDFDKKRVSLSIRATLEPTVEEVTEETAE